MLIPVAFQLNPFPVEVIPLKKGQASLILSITKKHIAEMEALEF